MARLTFDKMIADKGYRSEVVSTIKLTDREIKILAERFNGEIKLINGEFTNIYLPKDSSRQEIISQLDSYYSRFVTNDMAGNLIFCQKVSWFSDYID